MNEPDATSRGRLPVAMGGTVPEPVRIVDNTVREGVETPGYHFDPAGRLRFARQLDRLGVDFIEAGIPGASREEFESVRAVAGGGLTAKVSAIGRVFQPAFNEACLEAGVAAVHLAVVTSPAGIEHLLGSTRPRVIDASAAVVRGLKREGVGVFFSATDGSRAEIDFLAELYAAVADAGADVFVLADTVGVLSPPAVAAAVGHLRDRAHGALGVHCHNDFGLAVANSLAAVQAGATYVDASMCGVGSRSGNTNLAEFAAALHLLYGGRTNVRLERLTETASVLAALSGQPVHPGWPIVGERAFSSVDGVGLRTYPGPAASLMANAILTPEMVGNRAVALPRSAPRATPAT